MALNKEGRKSFTQLRRVLAQQSSMPRGSVNAATQFQSATRATMSTVTSGTGRHLPLSFFDTKQFSYGASPSEPVLEVIEKVKRSFCETTDALGACDREQRMSRGRRPTLLVYRVICTDEDAMHWPEEDIGNLRVALNALVRLFRLS